MHLPGPAEVVIFFKFKLVHLEIETRPSDGSHLMLTEWTPPRKSTHKMNDQSWVWRFPELIASLIRLRRTHVVLEILGKFNVGENI